MPTTPPIPPTDPAPVKKEGASSSPISGVSLESGEFAIDDKLTIEVELASYQQLATLTAELKRRVDVPARAALPAVDPAAPAAGPQVRIVFLDGALRTALELKSMLGIQLENLRQAYAGAAETAREALAALDPAPPPDVARRTREDRGGMVLESLGIGVPLVADAAVALIGALKTDTRYFGRQVVVPEQAFALGLAREWEADEQIEFLYPTLFVPPSDERRALMAEILDGLDRAVEERNIASKALSGLLARVSRMDPATAGFLAAKPALDTARDQFEAAEAVFDTLNTQLSKADEKTGLSQLQLLERAAFVEAKHLPGRTFYLFAQVVSAGGAFRTTNSFFRMLFKQPILEHAGGCIVTFGLFDDSGRLRASGTIGGRSAFQDSRPGPILR